jgi:hypothetical protein
VIETVNGSTNNVLSGGSTVAGSMLEVTNGTALTLEGTVANAGTIVVSGTTSAATLALDGATISGPGKLVTSGVSALIETVSGTADAMKGETLVSGALLEIVSSSTLTLSAGSLGASALAETASGGTAIVSSTLNNGGTLFASGAGSLVDIVGVVNRGIAEVGDGIIESAGSGSESVKFLSTRTGGLEIADTQAHTSALAATFPDWRAGSLKRLAVHRPHFGHLSRGHYLQLRFREHQQHQPDPVRLQRRTPGRHDRLGVDVLELRIAVGMFRALVGLAVRLPAVAERRQQSLHAAGADLVALLLQRGGQLVVAFRHPQQRAHGIAQRGRLDDVTQILDQRRVPARSKMTRSGHLVNGRCCGSRTLTWIK